MNRLAIKEASINFVKEYVISKLEGYNDIPLLGQFPDPNKITYPCAILDIEKSEQMLSKGTGLIDYDFFNEERTFQYRKDNTIVISTYAEIDTEAEMLSDALEILLLGLAVRIIPETDKLKLGSVRNVGTTKPKQVEKGEKKLWVASIYFNMMSHMIIKESSEDYQIIGEPSDYTTSPEPNLAEHKVYYRPYPSFTWTYIDGGTWDLDSDNTIDGGNW